MRPNHSGRKEEAQKTDAVASKVKVAEHHLSLAAPRFHCQEYTMLSRSCFIRGWFGGLIKSVTELSLGRKPAMPEQPPIPGCSSPHNEA